MHAKISILVLFLYCANFSDALIVRFGRCNSTVTPDSRFNIVTYSSDPWYEVGRTAQFLGRCPTLRYGYNALTRTSTMTYTSRLVPVGEFRIDASSSGNDTQSGIFSYRSTTYGFPINLPRAVVLRQEDQFAIKYYCADIFLIRFECYSILSRNREPRDGVIDSALSFLGSLGVNRRQIRYSNQRNCV